MSHTTSSADYATLCHEANEYADIMTEITELAAAVAVGAPADRVIALLAQVVDRGGAGTCNRLRVQLSSTGCAEAVAWTTASCANLAAEVEDMRARERDFCEEIHRLRTELAEAEAMQNDCINCGILQTEIDQLESKLVEQQQILRATLADRP